MSDEELVATSLAVLAADIDTAVEQFLDKVVPVISQHPDWYEKTDEDGDKVMCDPNELDNNLSRKIPRWDNESVKVESAGLDWFFLTDYLTQEVWDVVKRNRL